MESNTSPAPMRQLGEAMNCYLMPSLLSALMFLGIVNTAAVVRLMTGHPAWVTYLWGPVATWATWRVWTGARLPNPSDQRADQETSNGK